MIVHPWMHVFASIVSRSARSCGGGGDGKHNLCRNISFVPSHAPPAPSDRERLEEFLTRHDRLLVLTGAGISTESGIPDYRSEEVGLYARTNHKPVQYQEFIKHAKIRQRYWARNYVGWPRFSQVLPNSTHFAVQKLEKMGKLTSVVTQNVDRLHQRAGSQRVVELHGSAHDVSCLACDYRVSRHALQAEMARCNPDMTSRVQMIRPDGDVELTQEQVESFRPPHCPDCQGPLKPEIIFFGDNVPKARVEHVRREVGRSDALLVLGSTLTTYSSYRIVLQAKEEGKALAIVNIGPTRADAIVDFKISTKCGDILPPLCERL